MKEIVKKTLKNGIDVYLYSNKNLKKTIVSYNIKYGTLGMYNKFYYKDTLYEAPQAMAHFLEHLLIECSKYGNMFMRFKDKNYIANGATYRQLTSYYFVGIKEIKESIKELIHMVDCIAFDQESIEKTKRAILSEVVQSSDNKYKAASNLNLRNVFANFEVVGDNYNTLGTKESTESITYEQAKTCYDAYYHDQNKFLVIGGNFDEDEMIEYLEEIYREIEPHKNEMKPFDYGNNFAVRKEYDKLLRDVDNDILTLTYKFKVDSHTPKILVDLYSSIFLKLKFGQNTTLVDQMLKDNIIIDNMSYNIEFIEDILLMTFNAKVLNEKEYIKRVEESLNTENLDSHLFELTKRNWKVREISKIDSIYQALEIYPCDLIYSEKLYCIDEIDKCTLQNLKDFIDTLDFSTKVITVMKSNKENKKVD